MAMDTTKTHFRVSVMSQANHCLFFSSPFVEEGKTQAIILACMMTEAAFPVSEVAGHAAERVVLEFWSVPEQAWVVSQEWPYSGKLRAV